MEICFMSTTIALTDLYSGLISNHIFRLSTGASRMTRPAREGSDEAINISVGCPELARVAPAARPLPAPGKTTSRTAGETV